MAFSGLCFRSDAISLFQKISASYLGTATRAIFALDRFRIGW
jgi:hypothetical protein